MARGVCLGIFLLCLVQAEHVCCSWATQAQGSQSQNSNTYVGFSQQDRLNRLGSSYLQNQFRQASVAPGSAQSSSINTQTGYGQGLSSSGYTQAVSQPAQNSYASVRLGQSSSVSNPNWRTTSSTQLNAPKVPKTQFGLSTAIGSSASVSKYSAKKQNYPVSNSRTRPVQQGTQHTSQYLSSSYAPVLGHRESWSFRPASHQAAAQKPPSPSAPRGLAPMSSQLFNQRYTKQRNPIQMQTSARAPARRVSSRRTTGASKKPSSFSYPRTVTGGNAQGSYKPTSNMASSHVSYSQSLPASTYKQNAPVGFQQPRSLKAPTSSRAGTSAQRYAPTDTLNIPQRFGGFAIRRLRAPDQRQVSVRKPQQSYAAPPQQLASYKPQVQSVHQESKWKRIRPHMA